MAGTVNLGLFAEGALCGFPCNMQIASRAGSLCFAGRLSGVRESLPHFLQALQLPPQVQSELAASLPACKASITFSYTNSTLLLLFESERFTLRLARLAGCWCAGLSLQHATAPQSTSLLCLVDEAAGWLGLQSLFLRYNGLPAGTSPPATLGLPTSGFVPPELAGSPFLVRASFDLATKSIRSSPSNACMPWQKRLEPAAFSAVWW